MVPHCHSQIQVEVWEEEKTHLLVVVGVVVNCTCVCVCVWCSTYYGDKHRHECHQSQGSSIHGITVKVFPKLHQLQSSYTEAPHAGYADLHTFCYQCMHQHMHGQVMCVCVIS